MKAALFEKLADLLGYVRGPLWPDEDTVGRAALDEIFSLRTQLNRAVERANRTEIELDHVRRLIPWPTSVNHSTVEAVKAHLKKLEAAIEMQGREIVELKDQLAKLKPSEPKFRVGQVVCVTDAENPYFRRIVSIARDKWYGQPSWVYSSQTGSIHGENVLRALTDEEK